MLSQPSTAVDDDFDDGAADASSEFKGYIKIDSSNKNWEIDSKQSKLFKKTKWVITEKVHGANFCFYMTRNNNTTPLNEIQIECAKRKSLLSGSDQFFYYQKVKDRLKQSLERLFEFVEGKFSGISHVYLFGELFGGFYPGMERLEGIEQPVQTGIWYTNDIEFYVFDIAIEKDGIQTYLDYEFVLDLFTKYLSNLGILYAEPLFIGSYEECMEYNIKFDSKIPKKLKMPPLQEPNYAEGVVIKPMKEITISKKGKVERAIIKRKIQEFSEKKYEQAVKWSSNEQSSNPTSVNNYDICKYEALSCVTSNRLNNVLSKVGIVNKNDKVSMNNLLKLFAQDVYDELKEVMNIDQELNESQRKDLGDEIILECKKVIFEHFKK